MCAEELGWRMLVGELDARAAVERLGFGQSSRVAGTPVFPNHFFLPCRAFRAHNVCFICWSRRAGFQNWVLGLGHLFEGSSFPFTTHFLFGMPNPSSVGLSLRSTYTKYFGVGSVPFSV